MSAPTGWTLMRLGAMALAVAGSGCSGRADPAGEEAAPVVDVRVRPLEERTFRDVVAAPGQWKAANELTLVAPFAAVVEALRPRVGDTVARGQVIGQLVTRESRAALRGAELLLSQAHDAAARAEAARALELAQRDLVRVPLVATGGGTVLRRSVEPGAEVAEGSEMLAIVPQGTLVFEAHVPLAEASRVVIGQRSQITMEGSAPLDALVQRRLPGAGPADQSALVWLSPRSGIRPGLLDRFGTAVIEVGVSRVGVAVSDSALVEDDLTGEVRVARVDTSGVALWTPVRLGLAATGWHELRAPPLPPGTLVVVSGQRGLPDSTRVRARP